MSNFAELDKFKDSDSLIVYLLNNPQYDTYQQENGKRLIHYLMGRSLLPTDERLHIIVKRSLAASELADSNICAISTKNGDTPLHYAAIKDNISGLDFLKEFCNRKNIVFAVDEPNNANLTALHCAIIYGAAKAYSTLIVAGATTGPIQPNQDCILTFPSGCHTLVLKGKYFETPEELFIYCQLDLSQHKTSAPEIQTFLRNYSELAATLTATPKMSPISAPKATPQISAVQQVGTLLNAHLITELTKANEQIAKLKESLEQTQQAINIAERELNLREDQAKSLKEELEAAQENLAKREAALIQAHTEADQRKQETTSICQQLSEQQTEVSRLKERNAYLEKLVEKQSATINDLTSEKQSIKARLEADQSRLYQDNHFLRQHMQVQAKTEQQLREQLAARETQLAKASHIITAMRAAATAINTSVQHFLSITPRPGTTSAIDAAAAASPAAPRQAAPARATSSPAIPTPMWQPLSESRKQPLDTTQGQTSIPQAKRIERGPNT